ncbi:hypothetical protein BJ912DRAFT_982810 [Pholiota molesta]|nr:hypothetical protein BJ912DRAFT_982810 [Pholiota molesta]
MSCSADNIAISDRASPLDTICINKASSAELEESIRSMYKWYDNAHICIIYLAATTNASAMGVDFWFTRGWTLQELVAPKYIKFYEMRWNQLVADWSNDKTNPVILRNIESATMISHGDMTALSAVPISRRMQWAARREVIRGEDAAYSLMGIFNVNISTAYGEGPEQAFLHLLKEILNTATNDMIDIFNWAGEYPVHDSPLLPSSPKAYLRSWASAFPSYFPIPHCHIAPSVIIMRLSISKLLCLISRIPTMFSRPKFSISSRVLPSIAPELELRSQS